jgi:hypothetical protein
MTQRTQEYSRLADFDYSFLPASFWRDEVYYKATSEPCFVCGDKTERFNATIGAWECLPCGAEVEEKNAELSGDDHQIPLAFQQATLFGQYEDGGEGMACST